VGQLADAVIAAVEQWKTHAEQAGVSERDTDKVAVRIKL